VREFLVEERPRPEFRGVERRVSKITGENQLYYPRQARYRKYVHVRTCARIHSHTHATQQACRAVHGGHGETFVCLCLCR